MPVPKVAMRRALASRHHPLKLAILTILCLLSSADAETRRLVLKNGDEHYGELTVREHVVEVDTVSGRRLTFRHDEVAGFQVLSGEKTRTPPNAGPPSAPRTETPPVRETPPPQATPNPGSLPGIPALLSPPPSDVSPWWVTQRWVLVGLAMAFVALVFGVRGSSYSMARRIRVGVLFSILAVVGTWAFEVQRRREARREWRRPLHVAVVLVHDGPLRPEISALFSSRAMSVSDHFLGERRRYRAEARRPFWFHVVGPVPVVAPPPSPPEDDGLLARAEHGWALWKALRTIDTDAGLDRQVFDARVYVHARAAPLGRAPRFVEGAGQKDGEVGLVEVDLEPRMVDQAWIAIVHEVMHMVGATDKYDERGRARIPEGLAEPELSPTLPQRAVEIMVGERPTGPDTGVLASDLTEVQVGPFTAMEIGWR